MGSIFKTWELICLMLDNKIWKQQGRALSENHDFCGILSSLSEREIGARKKQNWKVRRRSKFRGTVRDIFSGLPKLFLTHISFMLGETQICLVIYLPFATLYSQAKGI